MNRRYGIEGSTTRDVLFLAWGALISDMPHRVARTAYSFDHALEFFAIHGESGIHRLFSASDTEMLFDHACAKSCGGDVHRPAH